MTSWAVMHEWVEFSIIFPSLYDDLSLRFAGDGLAEFLCYEFVRLSDAGLLRFWLQSRLQSLKALQAQGQAAYDLDAFQAQPPTSVPASESPAGPPSTIETAGYGVSFWLWRTVHQRGGVEAIRGILSYLRKTAGIRRESLIQKVRDLAGADIRTQIPLAEIISDFERLVRSAQ
jgi:hypothetical protein